jgi:hypothetical protein
MRLREYIFDRSYGDGQELTSYQCAGINGNAGPYGVTRSRGAKASLLALCDTSFRLNGRRLHEVDPECAYASTIVDNKAPRTATSIDKVEVDAGTFFHELFHLVLGNRQTTPAGGEEYSPAKMLGKVVRQPGGSLMTWSGVSINPQNYVYVA